MTPSTLGRARRATLVLASATLVLTACGGQDDGTADNDDGRAAAEEPAGEEGGPGPEEEDEEAAELTAAVNEAMGATTFHAIGGTTAFEGAQQELWADPEVGLRLEVSGEGMPDSELYCENGVIHSGVTLFTEQLRQAGEEIDVPEELAGHYVSTPAGNGCEALYSLYPGATVGPDSSVGGADTMTLVLESQGNTDTYHIAAEGEPLLLQLDSVYQGRESQTLYDSFGEPVEINLPSEDLLIPMEEFRDLVAP